MQVASQKAQRAQQVLQLQVRTSDKNIQCWLLKTKHCFKCMSLSLSFFFLCLQVFQLQQEKKKLQEDFAQLLKEREQLEERCTSYEHEKIQLGPRLEETKWEVSGCSLNSYII